MFQGAARPNREKRLLGVAERLYLNVVPSRAVEQEKAPPWRKVISRIALTRHNSPMARDTSGLSTCSSSIAASDQGTLAEDHQENVFQTALIAFPLARQPASGARRKHALAPRDAELVIRVTARRRQPDQRRQNESFTAAVALNCTNVLQRTNFS